MRLVRLAIGPHLLEFERLERSDRSFALGHVRRVVFRRSWHVTATPLFDVGEAADNYARSALVMEGAIFVALVVGKLFAAPATGRLGNEFTFHWSAPGPSVRQLVVVAIVLVEAITKGLILL